MNSTSPPAALYSNGQMPLFLDLAEISFVFEDVPAITAHVRLAHVDYERRMATAVFSEHDTGFIQAFGPSLTIPLDQLSFLRRGPAWSPDMHELAMQTLKAVPRARGTSVDPEHAGTLIAERNRLAHAGAAIDDYIYYTHAETFSHDCTVNAEGHPPEHFAGIAAKARDTALTRLSRLSDAQALTVIEGNRIPDLDGSSFPIASIEEVQKRRAHLVNMRSYHAAAKRILEHLRGRRALRAAARMSRHRRADLA
jgi:hypothetical protein